MSIRQSGSLLRRIDLLPALREDFQGNTMICEWKN
jgi:hypothetical protein